MAADMDKLCHQFAAIRWKKAEVTDDDRRCKVESSSHSTMGAKSSYAAKRKQELKAVSAASGHRAVSLTGGCGASSRHQPVAFVRQTKESQQEEQQDSNKQQESKSAGEAKPAGGIFVHAQPITGGIGHQLLQKMGWQRGQGLGRKNEGSVEPVPVSYKTDRKGLASQEEKTKLPFRKQLQSGGTFAGPSSSVPIVKTCDPASPLSVCLAGSCDTTGRSAPPRSTAAVPGSSNSSSRRSSRPLLLWHGHQARSRQPDKKHPVWQLMDLARRYNWPKPLLRPALVGGPDHAKFFLFSVRIGHLQFQPARPSRSKKAAKASAAVHALQQMGHRPGQYLY